MLQVLARLVRPAPPVVEEVVSAPAPRPLWEGLTPDEYRQLIRARVVARAHEEAAWRAQMARVEEERVRLRRMWAAAEDRDSIRSSRWITGTGTTKEK